MEITVKSYLECEACIACVLIPAFGLSGYCFFHKMHMEHITFNME